MLDSHNVPIISVFFTLPVMIYQDIHLFMGMSLKP